MNEKKEMICYAELYQILYEKYKATDEEVKYWVKMGKKINSDNYLTPYRSDIPFDLENHHYLLPVGEFLYPEYCFYRKKEAQMFIPFPHYRFVYLRNLKSHRNWYDDNNSNHSRIFDILKKSNEIGILRVYDNSSQDFTLEKISKAFSTSTSEIYNKQLWCYTFEGEKIFSDPDSFFLLYDIITIERVFFSKDRKWCLEELYPHLEGKI